MDSGFWSMYASYYTSCGCTYEHVPIVVHVVCKVQCCMFLPVLFDFCSENPEIIYHIRENL